MSSIKVAITYAPSEQQFLPVPPLGISALSQHLLNEGIENDVIDLELELWLSQNGKSSKFASKKVHELDVKKLPVDSLVDILIGYNVVTFSLMGKRQLPYVLAIAERLRQKADGLKCIIVGGAFFNETNSRNVMETWGELIDSVIVGEGWMPMQKILNSIETEKKECSIPGVAFLDDKGEYNYKKNLVWEGDLPIPNYKDINYEGYVKQQKALYGLKDNRLIYHVLVGDRKCPYKCSFCRISENTKEVKSPTEIADEMIILNRECNADRFSLVCNEMNPTEKYFDEFLERLLSYNKKIFWFCYLRPNNLSLEMLMKARKAGCVLVRYGVETGSQKILDNMNKKLNVNEIQQIMRDTNKAGIWNHINIVTGYLYENAQDVKLTLDFIEENKNYIDSIRVNPFYIPIDSPIHKNPAKFGIKLRDNKGSYVQFDEYNKTWEEKQDWIKGVTEKVLSKCIESKINFAGILPFLVATAVAHFDNVKLAKEWIQNNHSYLCQPISPDTAKWRLAHPDKANIEINKWSEIAGRRGTNYQTLSEMNDDVEEDSY